MGRRSGAAAGRADALLILFLGARRALPDGLLPSERELSHADTSVSTVRCEAFARKSAPE